MAVYTDILKELRRDKHLTQLDLAKHFGISQTMYSMYESGRRTMKLEMLCELADILETSTDYILGRTAQHRPTQLQPQQWQARAAECINKPKPNI